MSSTKQMILIGLVLIAAFSTACGKKIRKDFYDEANYQKSGQHSNRKQGFEIYFFRYDTSRKMVKYFWDNGNIQLVGFFDGKMKDGRWVTYFDTGEIMSEAFFKKNFRDSTQTFYFSNGKIASIQKFQSGKKTGVWIDFDTAGKIISQVNYD